MDLIEVTAVCERLDALLRERRGQPATISR
jgi:hypothetical protein